MKTRRNAIAMLLSSHVSHRAGIPSKGELSLLVWPKVKRVKSLQFFMAR